MFRPTCEDMKNWIDELITPELADREAKRLDDLIKAVSDREGEPEAYELAQFARRYAYQKTADFESSFGKWSAGIGEMIYQDEEKVSGSSRLH